MKREFLDTFFLNIQISNFVKIRQIWARLFPAGRGKTDRHDKANSYFSQLRERA